MRILLDECLPARFRRELPGHEVQTVPQAGWASIKNGKLLQLIAASEKFDMLLTVDKKLPDKIKFPRFRLPLWFFAPTQIASLQLDHLLRKLYGGFRNFNADKFIF
jgi:hypothetical protein